MNTSLSPQTMQWGQVVGLAMSLSGCGARTGLEDPNTGQVAYPPSFPVNCGTTPLDHCVLEALSTLTVTAHAQETYSSVIALMADGHVKFRGARDRRSVIGTIEGLRDIVDIDANSENIMAAVDRNGHVWVYGTNSNGPLGPGIPPYTDRGMPLGQEAAVPMMIQGLSSIVQVAVGQRHLLALDKNGQVFAWGDNMFGQLGDGTTTDNEVPQRVMGLPPIVYIRAGGVGSVAVDRAGHIWAWGGGTRPSNGPSCTQGQVQLTPRQQPYVSELKDLQFGGGFYLALAAGGRIYTWGCNSLGMLGTGNNQNLSSPHLFGITEVVGLGVSMTQSFLIKGNSSEMGRGAVVEFGDVGSMNTRDGGNPSPTPVSGLPGDIVSVDGGYRHHRVALSRDGRRVWVWGDNAQFGEARPPVEVSF